MKNEKTTITKAIKDLQVYKGTWNELIGVIIELVLAFLANNFLKNGVLSVPKLLNPVFILNAGKFILKIIDCIKLYKSDYDAWRDKYITNATNDYYEIDRYFGTL